MANTPKILEASVGGYMGPAYRVVLQEHGLGYQSSPGGYQFGEEEVISVSPAMWERFAKKLEHLGVWKWSESYVDEGVLDGTSWGVTLHWGERQLESSGHNDYPDGWDGFCRAVEALIEGRAFR